MPTFVFLLSLLSLSFSAFCLLGTLCTMIRRPYWWVRMFDFPRLHMCAFCVIALAWHVSLFPWSVSTWLLLIALFLSAGSQFIKIFPYTRWTAKEVLDAPEGEALPGFTLMVANVLTTNRNIDALYKQVEEHQPDLLLTLESDQWWQDQLDERMEPRYEWSIKQPLDNLYGMHLYSRLPLVDEEIRELVRDDIPSFRTKVRLETGELFWLHCLHPRPPAPEEAPLTTERDAELLLVGQEASEHSIPCVIAGDLNDVAWSYTTTLFQKQSGLLDPRKGRGMFNSFHAKYFWLRWPLDHVFTSHHWKVRTLQRLDAFGSDHFPILASLVLDHGGQSAGRGPSMTAKDKQVAEGTLENAAEEYDGLETQGDVLT